MKSILIGVVIFAAIIGVIYYIQSNKSSDSLYDENQKMEDDSSAIEDTNAMPVPDEGGTVEENIATKIFTLSQIASHNNENDCWIAIHGKVYDVTAFIPMHPGGAAILQGCGKDATELFETRPTGSGTPHSEGARNKLENYYIGDLAQ